MQNYYWGLTLEQTVIAFVIFSAMAVFVSYKYIKGSEMLVVPVFICVALAVPLMSISIDLGQGVIATKGIASLNVAVEESRGMRNGKEFQTAVNKLFEEKGAVYSDTSYTNKFANTVNINKSEWNKLAKVYNNIKDKG